MAATQVKSKLQKPWISTPELVSRGKELFQAQCTSCHGAEGKGNGPAAAALNPPPRNFTSDQGWKNGRKATMVFKTLKEGLAGSSMASYATLPVDDRWALVQYVLSLGGKPAEADSEADFAKAGINPAGGAEAPEAPTIPVAVAMKQMEVREVPTSGALVSYSHMEEGTAQSVGGKVYAARCLNCHGAQAQGGIIVKSLGVNPKAYLTSSPLTANLASMQSFESFKRVVVDGLPGEKVMPGAGDLSSTELQDLFQYIKSLVH
jgi:mono/diheme cytochrome c family protein